MLITSKEQISKHFHGDEFACPCCGVIKIDLHLIDALEILRESINCPLRILSGYRCDKHNRAVGGELNSQHTLGRAADVLSPARSLEDFYKYCCSVIGFNGIGVYPSDGFQHSSFLHLDVRDTYARWARVHGKYVDVQEGLDYGR